MGALDHQLGVVDEVTYGTPVTVTKFFEYNSESIEDTYGRTESTPLRVGQFVNRNDRHTPYYAGAAGTVSVDVLTKGFGFWLKHMLGTVGTSGAGPFVHTGTFGDLLGDFFTMQVNRPFHPAGTNQAFTYSGGKVASWTLANSVDGNLVAELECDFQQVSTAVGLATASYPASANNFAWSHGVISVAGSSYDVSEFSLACNNGLNVERRHIRGNALKKEPTGGRREVTWSLAGDFDALTLRTKAASATKTDNLATIIGTWTNGADILTATIDEARIDGWTTGDREAGATQTLSGVGTTDGTTSPVTIVYTSGDATP